MRIIRTFATSCAFALVAILPAQALETSLFKAYTIQADFDQVRQDAEDAIINRGFAIDYNGYIGDMLKRTGGDVGSTKPLYERAEFMTFCSARLSRATMEADIQNINLCPYNIIVYEPSDEPGTVYVSYRKPTAAIPGTPHESIIAVEKVLDDIAREATE